jgi:protein HOOK3
MVLNTTLARYRHAADKLQKTENVMEKYKKKLQEGADLRQSVKVLYSSINMPLLKKVASVRPWKDKMQTLWIRMRL